MGGAAKGRKGLAGAHFRYRRITSGKELA